jgi:SAM-dependent methyltransferase
MTTEELKEQHERIERDKTFIVSDQNTYYHKPNFRSTLDTLYLSERVTVEATLPHVKTVLDIGCSTGRLCEIFEGNRISYTGIDIDESSISIAKETYSQSKFYTADFMNENFIIEQSDLVIALNVFDHFFDWKGALRNMRRFSKKFINFSCNMRLEGQTVIDKDLGYLYYGNGQRRLGWGIHNVFQLAAYAATEEIQAKSIFIYCYHKFTDQKNNWHTSAKSVMPISPHDHLTGNILIEVSDIEYMAKTGIRPDLKIVVDDETIFDSPWKKNMQGDFHALVQQHIDQAYNYIEKK